MVALNVHQVEVVWFGPSYNYLGCRFGRIESVP